MYRRRSVMRSLMMRARPVSNRFVLRLVHLSLVLFFHVNRYTMRGNVVRLLGLLLFSLWLLLFLLWLLGDRSWLIVHLRSVMDRCLAILVIIITLF